LLTAGEVVGKLGTLVVVVGAARLLPLPDFGVFAVALGVGALVSVVPAWGFDTLLVQRGAASPAVLPGLLTELVALRTGLVVAVLALVGGVAVAAGAPAPVLLPAGCVVLACLAETVADAFRGVAIALEAPVVVAAAQLVQRGVTAVLVLAVLFARPELLALSVAYLGGAGVGIIATAVGAARLGVRPSRAMLSWSGVARLGRVSHASGLHTVASMALFRIDAVLVAMLAGAAAAGRYAAAYRLLETVIFVAWTVVRGVFPVMASSADVGGVRNGARRGLAVLASVFLPYMVLLWCRGEDVLRILYGESFMDGDTAVVAWLAPAPMFFGAAYLAAYVLMVGGPTSRVLVGSVGALVLNVMLNVALIPRYGPAGAAAATTWSYAAETALLYPAASRRAGRPALGRPLFPALLASVSAAVVLLLPVPFAVALAIAAVVYASVWLLSAVRIDPEQFEVVRGVWLRAPGQPRVARREPV
jgi:O-antigen/teichoic acid export membrane protein